MHRILCLITLILISVNLGLSARNSGTTANLEEIFLGSCCQYQQLPRVSSSIKALNCKDLFGLFTAPFIYKDDCDWNSQSFDELFSAIKEELPENKLLFWSKTKQLAKQIGNGENNYLSLEATMFGFIADNLNWCGQKQAPGVNHSYCEADCGKTKKSASSEYWKRASKNFAESARGEVTVLLNGSLDNKNLAFDPINSFFGNTELPNLSPLVDKVNIILVHNLNGPKRETCTSKNIMELREEIEKTNRQYTCSEDPDEIRFWQCSQNPKANNCLGKQPSSRKLSIKAYDYGRRKRRRN